jgi:hypothetical protein
LAHFSGVSHDDSPAMSRLWRYPVARQKGTRFGGAMSEVFDEDQGTGVANGDGTGTGSRVISRD